MRIARHFSAGTPLRTRSCQSVKRTAETLEYPTFFSRPLRGLGNLAILEPSTKVLGYFRIVRYARTGASGPNSCFPFSRSPVITGMKPGLTGMSRISFGNLFGVCNL